MTSTPGPVAVPRTSDLELWPFAGLRVVSGDLELRYIDDSLLFPLARLAGAGVHDQDTMPFMTPWTRGTPAEVARSVLAYQWQQRAAISPEKVGLELAVVRGEEVLGIQGFYASSYAITRTAETGSWLGVRYQHQGIGTRMRRMVLHLLFVGLGAEVATTGAFADNAASTGVTHRLGYEPNGVEIVTREGKAAVSNRYRLTREAWQARSDRPDVEVHGVGPVREFLGIEAA